jgi:hypothetical protein
MERRAMAEEQLQQQEVLVQAIEKGLGERIHVRVSQFKGRVYLDVRNFYEDDAGEWKPTRKGVSVPVELYEQLQQAILQAKPEIDRMVATAPSKG